MESKHKSDYGKFVLTAGKFYGDVEKDKGKQCANPSVFLVLICVFILGVGPVCCRCIDRGLERDLE